MTPAARLQASIEILDEILAAQAAQGLPADRLIQTYCRNRRYMGSGDRRAITGRVYDILRNRGILEWLLQPGEAPVTGRSLMLAFLVQDAENAAEQAVNLFGSGAYGAAVLSNDENRLLEELNYKWQNKPAHLPDWARLNVPEEIHPQIIEAFGGQADAALSGFAERASVDLRVNTLKTSQRTALKELPDSAVMPFAPYGVRLPPASQVSRHSLVRDGSVEIQDEASQIAAALVGAQPGHTVIDYCAGAGGKTLALAGHLDNRGDLWAHDPRPEAQKQLEKRAKRAGAKVHMADATHPLPEQADRVLVDAPCSSSGTWRRNPDARWRLSEKVLTDFAALQDGVLAAAAEHVRPGGYLVYAVCSFLPIEGPDRVQAFLESHTDFHIVPYVDCWQADTPCPETLSADPRFLLLAPHTHGCDGFFVAVLQRREGV